MSLSITDRMTVTVPEGEYGGLRVERFTVGREPTVQSMRLALQGRAVRPGTYTRMIDYKTRTFWMSDTPAERGDHYEAVKMIRDLMATRVLINGLGLGMVLAAALSFDHVKHVDVVERDERVIRLVGPHYTRDGRVTIHHADAYEQSKTWPVGIGWDVGWSDIWPELCTDDLKDHARLNRSYGRRCTWHECWGHDFLIDRRRREQRYY